MKHTFWTLIGISDNATRRTWKVAFSGVVLRLLFVCICIGLIGFARLAFITSNFAYQKVKLRYELERNKMLCDNIKTYEQIQSHAAGKLKSIVQFEDTCRLRFGIAAIDKDVRLAGVGGLPTKSGIPAGADSLAYQADSVHEMLESIERQTALADSTFMQMVRHVQFQYDLWEHSPSIFPVQGQITSYFGYRIHPITGMRTIHEGLDIASPIGTPIYAPANGVVRTVDVQTYFGNVIILDHKINGVTTIYAHLQRAVVKRGQAIRRGELIGFVGTSGRSTGPHLHYEVHKLASLQNPLDFILTGDVVFD